MKSETYTESLLGTPAREPPKNVIHYSEGESEEDEKRVDFKKIRSPVERRQHIKDLWKKCWLKALGGRYVIRVMASITAQINKYGTSKHMNYAYADKVKYIE